MPILSREFELSPLRISRILHAGYVFECDQAQIAFDPIFENPFSRNCHAFPDVSFDQIAIKKLKFSAVFISHYHDDHCSLESLNLLDRETPIYIYCIFEELFSMVKALGFTNVYALKIDTPVVVDSFEIIPRRALDQDVDSIFHVKVAGLNILNVVDSWIDFETLDQLAQVAPWDLVLWPFQTMREIEVLSPSRATPAPKHLPAEWTNQLKILNPRYIVPSSCQFKLESWSWYNQAFFPITYRQFQTEVSKILPSSQVVRMNPGVSILLEAKSVEQAEPLTWIQPRGEQDVDYEYEENLKVPTTAEIAQHFAALSLAQTKRVIDFCQEGLLVKFKSMEPSQDSYFKKTRIWKLSVYDHLGVGAHFNYQLQGSEIQLCTGRDEQLGWTTELPIAKFYAALEDGESLTSMYLRINDMLFAAEIEKEIALVEVVEDPLVRCLFNGVFGAYQAAQLRRLHLK